MGSLRLQDIRKSYGQTHILKGIDLQAEDGELVVLVGPSGCGKSTLLRTIAGLETPDTGTIHIGDRDVTRLEPKDRDVAMVFQSYALYPHLTVGKNLSFGLELRSTPSDVVRARVQEVATMLGLEELLDRYPRQLSGGQRQRVAMGRAIARRPTLFLFDEPLSNLDAALRNEVRVEVKKLHAELGATMVYVTHDQVEAMTLADTLVVLNGGRIEQMGAPLDLYETPETRFVAGFMGTPGMNFLEGEIREGRFRGTGVEASVATSVEGPVVLGVRPHDLAIDDAGEIELKVEVVEAMGFESYAHGMLGETRFVARVEGHGSNVASYRDASRDVHSTLARGDVLRLKITRHHLFDAKTGARCAT